MFLEVGCGADLLINILLTILGKLSLWLCALATALPDGSETGGSLPQCRLPVLVVANGFYAYLIVC